MIVLLFGFSLLSLGCSRRLPDIPFGGARATYEIDQSQVDSLIAYSTPVVSETKESGDDQTLSTNTAEYGPQPTLENKTDETAQPTNLSGQEATNTSSPEPSATLTWAPNATPTSPPIATPTLVPEATPTPTRFESDDEIAFYEFWEGDWHMWFEDSGRLLEGEIVFVQDEASLLGKTEMDGRTFAFVIKYVEDQDFFENFVYGEWVADNMENAILFRLRAQNDFQVAGHHSSPSRTFCLSRDAEKKPDPCYVEFSGDS